MLKYGGSVGWIRFSGDIIEQFQKKTTKKCMKIMKFKHILRFNDFFKK